MRAPSGGSSLPTSRVRSRANPEGILQQSPGVRAASYPGSTESRRTNPNGVACVGGERGHNPVGVETRFARYPRVAPPLFLGRGINTAVAHCKHLRCINGEGLSERAGSQPWAGGHNPFGIAFKGIPDLWVMIRSYREDHAGFPAWSICRQPRASTGFRRRLASYLV